MRTSDVIPFRVFIALLAAATLSISCAGTPTADAVAQPALVWPAPPEPARIRFEQAFSSAQDLGIRDRWWHKAVDWLVGRQPQPLVRPQGLTTDAQGRLYVVDAFYHAVHMFDATRREHFLFPEEAPGGFSNPVDVAVADDGRVFVSDSGSGRVHVFGAQGREFIQAVGESRLQRPTGLALSPDTNELLILDTLASRLVVYTLDSLEFKAALGIGKDEQFHYPTHLWVDADGRIYVSDALNFLVRILDKDKRLVQSFGGPGLVPGTFSRPKGIATDSDGHIYVVDALFDNVQILDDSGRPLLAFGSAGTNIGEFWLPNGIHIDRADRIYIADAYNQRIQIFQYLKVEATRP